jgi:hypothetical protein
LSFGFVGSLSGIRFSLTGRDFSHVKGPTPLNSVPRNCRSKAPHGVTSLCGEIGEGWPLVSIFVLKLGDHVEVSSMRPAYPDDG